MAKQVILPDGVRRRNRRLSGLPAVPRERRRRPWWQRLLLDHRTWIFLLATAVYAAALAYQWFEFFAERQVQGQTVGFTTDLLATCAKMALPTLAVWAVVFLLIDRWRPQRLLLWWLALGWGGSIATLTSIVINSWADSHLNVAGADPGGASAQRSAVYIAPFVEEAMKASILFLLVILLRHRITNRLSLITLAGLSAIGFAFTENIIYYLRVYGFVLTNAGAGDADQALHEIVMARGVYTSFGHWSFTTLTGIGLALGLRARSKSMRVLAPVTGYLMASLGHMFFNSQLGQIAGDSRQILLFFLIGACLWLLMMAVGNWFVERTLIRARLTDYVRMGWLRASDPLVFGSGWRRWQILWLSLFEGWRGFRSTVLMTREMTELAYLRDAMTRGLVDQTGFDREKELLFSLRDRRGTAIDDPRGRKHRPIWGRWRWMRRFRRPATAAPRA